LIKFLSHQDAKKLPFGDSQITKIRSTDHLESVRYIINTLADYHTNLIRFGARDYDPSIGRWTSKEPLGFGGALNWYVYVGNDPVNSYDVNGESVEYLIDVLQKQLCEHSSISISIGAGPISAGLEWNPGSNSISGNIEGGQVSGGFSLDAGISTGKDDGGMYVETTVPLPGFATTLSTETGLGVDYINTKGGRPSTVVGFKWKDLVKLGPSLCTDDASLEDVPAKDENDGC
jgi:RHS repeat-associated protein